MINKLLLAFQQNKSDNAIYLQIVRYYRDNKKFIEAEKFINENESFKNDDRVQFELANIYICTDKKEEAIDVFEKLIKKGSEILNIADVVLELVKLYKEKQEYEKAIEIIKVVLEKCPNDDKVNKIKFELASIYICIGKKEQAIEIFESLMKSEDVNIADITLDLIKLYKEKQEYEKAIEIINAALERDSNDKIKFELGNIYFIKQNYQKSEKIFLELQKHTPFFVVSTEMLQKIYKISHLYNKSLIQFYKLYKYHKIENHNIYDALESALVQKRYNTYLKILMIAKNNNIFNYEFISNKLKEIYKEIIRLISYFNVEFNYNNVKKTYRKVVNLIPKEEKKVQNILLNEYEIATGCYKLKSKPRSLTLQLTNKCNLRCIMCEYKNVEKNWEISDSVYNELLELMPCLEHLVLQGGEIFLYKNIKKILEVAVKENVSVEIVTNGLLLNEEFSSILINGKNTITFSIDSIDKGVYETIRVNGKFEKLIENLDALLKMKRMQKSDIFLRLHMVVMRKNYREIEDIIKFAGRYEFNEVYLEPVANNFIEQKESIFEFGYDKGVVSLLESKKNIFDNLAKQNNIKLINHLPSVKYCESLIKPKHYNKNNFNNTRKSNIKKYLFLFKTRKSNNMNYNYTISTYKKLNFNKSRLNNKKMFCYAPWQKLSIYNRNISVPTCFCPVLIDKIMLNPLLEKLKNYILNFSVNKPFIISEWNDKLMIYYRKVILSKQEQQVCAKDCLDNRIVLKDRIVRYD